MESREPFYHRDEDRHYSGASKNENVVLPLVLDNFLDLPQDRLDLLIVNGLGPNGLVQFDGQFEEP
jgi:hypothetical protein